MKTSIIIRLSIGLFLGGFFLSSLLVLPRQARATETGSLQTDEKYSQEELAQLLAPIALYPDALLSQILMASTYPIEVIEADRWSRRNQQLQGDALDDALQERDWDPSVKAICHFPSVLALMSEQIADTTSLGNAFLAQEDEVMNMVQVLRGKAYAAGNLGTTSEQKIIVEKQAIIIQPADTRVIYVPYYDPFQIYGPWWYPAYPPRYWGPPGVHIGFGISYWPGFHFTFSYGTWSYVDWHRRHIFIDVHQRPRYVRQDRWQARPGRWHHAPEHRRGIVYRDISSTRKYGQRNIREVTDRRIETRSRIDRGRNEADRAGTIQHQREQKRELRAGPARVNTDSRLQKRETVQRVQPPRTKEGNRKERPPSAPETVKRPANTERVKSKAQSVSPKEQTTRQEERRSEKAYHRDDSAREENRSSERGREGRQNRGEAPRSRSETRERGRT